MKKQLLFILAAACLSSSNVMAQSEIQAGEGQQWWNNYDQNASIRYIDGTNVAEHYDAAVFIPQGLVAQGDVTIDGFSFYPVTAAAENVKVWVATSLTDNSGQWLETVNVSSSSLVRNQFYDVAFKKQHAIPAGGLYVGVSFDIKDFSDNYAGTPLSYTNTAANRPNSFFYKTTTKIAWTPIEGNAFVRILFGGGSFKKNAVEVSDFARSYAVKGESTSVPVTLCNMGTTPVETISYTITTDSTTSAEVTKRVIIKKYQESLTTTIDFPADMETTVKSKRLTVTKVNGQPNEGDDIVGQGQLVTVAERYQAVPVVEAFLSTSNAYSPTTITGLQKSGERFGDQAALIAVHLDDVMATADYKPLLYSVSAMPSAFLNRQYEVYPSAYFLKNDIERELKRTVPAKISLTAEWDGYIENATDVILKTSSTFCYDDDNADYGVAYVIIADGLKGKGSEWYQSNYYSGKSGYGDDLSEWYSAPETVMDMTYDNVAVAAKDIFSGTKLLTTKSVANGQTVDHHTKISLAGNKLVQDKGRLTAVALLFDRSNNQVVNAAKAVVGGGGQGIDGVADDKDDTAVATYDLSGRKVGTNQKGLNIIRMANGKSRKVIR